MKKNTNHKEMTEKQKEAGKKLLDALTAGKTPEQKKAIIESFCNNPFEALANHFAKGNPQKKKEFLKFCVADMKARKKGWEAISSTKKQARERN